MHIPDGFLNVQTATASAALAAAGVGIAVRQVKRSFPPARIAEMGLASAFIFAAQMLNFPVMGGTSGHLIGAALVSVLLGPSAAVIVMSSVLVLQCLMFADGGLIVLGANVFNMAVAAPCAGYAVYRFLHRALGGGERARFAAIAVAAWLSTVLASIICAGQLAASGAAAWGVVFPAMAGVHALIGVGEAIITVLVVAAVARIAPELGVASLSQSQPVEVRPLIGYGLVISFGLVLFVAPFASSRPDGLERVADSLGFGGAASAALVATPLADYGVEGALSSGWATVIAGGIGTIAAFIFTYVVSRLAVRRTRHVADRP